MGVGGIAALVNNRDPQGMIPVAWTALQQQGIASL